MGVRITFEEVIVPTNGLSNETGFIVLERISTQNRLFSSSCSSEGNEVAATIIKTGLFSYEQLKTCLTYYYYIVFLIKKNGINK